MVLYICAGLSLWLYINTLSSAWLFVFLTQIPCLIYQNLQISFRFQDKQHRHILFLVLAAAGIINTELMILHNTNEPISAIWLLSSVLFIIAYYVLIFYIPKLPIDHESQTLREGNLMPDFILSSSDGIEVSSTDLHGSPNILLFFRGNWCPFCMSQVSAVAKSYKEIQRRGIRVVLISPQHNRKSKALARRFKVDFLFLEDKDLTYAKTLNIIHKDGVPAGIYGYDSDTVLPMLILTDTHFRVRHLIQTDNFRVRPEPEDFLKVIDQIKIRSFLEERVAERTKELRQEQQKIDDLLQNILPNHAIIELKEYGYTTPRSYEKVAILFADIVGFSHWARDLSAKEVIDHLHHIYKGFDQIVEQYKLEKIKTIGDAYMCVAGIPDWSQCTPDCLLKAANEMAQFLDSTGIQMRFGIHLGPVVTGVVGKNKYAYDVYGDSVNVAARMETASLPGKINISSSFKDALSNNYQFIPRGHVGVKNIGEIEMFFVRNRTDETTKS